MNGSQEMRIKLENVLTFSVLTETNFCSSLENNLCLSVVSKANGHDTDMLSKNNHQTTLN